MQKSLIVVDDLKHWSPYYPSELVISFQDYLELKESTVQQTRRVINLCKAEKYLGNGYYCSLLAEARGHRVLPTVDAINDLRMRQLYLVALGDLKDLKIPAWTDTERGTHTFKVYFGTSTQETLRGISRRIFERLNFPLLEVELHNNSGWALKSVRAVDLTSLNEEEQTEFAEALERFSQMIWRKKQRTPQARWQMAILIDTEEKLPPSNTGAIRKFIKAASKLGIEAETISSKDITRLSEYDALFIRETTEINHHTYRFARRAQLEGIVVIDDPDSILRCCNKVYLTDAFHRHRVPTLKSKILLSKIQRHLEDLENEFTYPFILKIPNSSFSKGVFKIEDRKSLRSKLKELFQQSSLVLAQEYLFTDFDWRVGVLNHKPLYANRYYMAKNHWQIYDHGSGPVKSGGFDSMPTFEVPKVVLNAAVKAANIIGDGLYGIDIKQKGNTAYVIEVNDNPSIDQGVEDAFIGDELYMQIMAEFARRLEARGKRNEDHY